jgi:hypothetical protein
MSDIKRMLQEAAENPRPLDLDRVHRVGRRRRQRPKLVVLGLASVILVAAAAGVLVTRDDSPAPHISAEPPTTGAAPTVTTSPSQSPAPRQMAWWVQTSDALVIRVGDSAGGGFRTVAALSQQAVPLAMRADRMMYVLDTHLHGLELPSGRDTDYGGGPEYYFTGGAFNPDGTQFAYVRATQESAAIRVLDLTSGSIRELHRFQDKWDLPTVWTADAIASVGVYGFSEGTYNVARLDPATGNTVAATSVPWGATIADDGRWAAAADDLDLGDKTSQSVLPPGPFNTLYLFEVGGGRRTVIQQPHHNISPLAVASGGTRVLYLDAPDAGISPDASSSPDYGLFVLTNGSATRLAPYGNRWSPAEYIDRDGRFAVVRGDVSSATLAVWDGASFHDLDPLDLGGLSPTGSGFRAGLAIAAARS